MWRISGVESRITYGWGFGKMICVGGGILSLSASYCYLLSRTGNSRRLRTMFLQQFDRLSSHSFWVVTVDRHQHVFWLQICVNNLALAVKVVETFQCLLQAHINNVSDIDTAKTSVCFCLEIHRERKKRAVLFSSKLLQMLTNLNENFRQYSWGNAEFTHLNCISAKYSLLAAM